MQIFSMFFQHGNGLFLADFPECADFRFDQIKIVNSLIETIA